MPSRATLRRRLSHAVGCRTAAQSVAVGIAQGAQTVAADALAVATAACIVNPETCGAVALAVAALGVANAELTLLVVAAATTLRHARCTATSISTTMSGAM
jgi:hypothetical protein